MYKRLATVITRVVDGDTIQIAVDIGNQPCRLNHIDAPERGEPFWREAKNHIENNWMSEEVWVTCTGIDRYGRWIVIVENHYGNMLHWELLRKGLAFHWRKYSKEQESFILSKQAQNDGVGLWSIPNSFTKWRERIKEKEAFEKKNENDSGNTPFLLLVLEQYSDSDIDVGEIPGFMVDCRNYEKPKSLEELKTPFETLGRNQWYV